MDAGINLDIIVNDISPRLSDAIGSILSSSLDVATKKSRIQLLLTGIGAHFKSKTFTDTSAIFDSDISGGALTNDESLQSLSLAVKVARNYALERDFRQLISSYLSSLLGSARYEAFTNAVSLSKHPTLVRSIVSETCNWCEAKAGVHVNPTRDDFKRHTDCDCRFVVTGYNTRNGEIKNYKKRR